MVAKPFLSKGPKGSHADIFSRAASDTLPRVRRSEVKSGLPQIILCAFWLFVWPAGSGIQRQPGLSAAAVEDQWRISDVSPRRSSLARHNWCGSYAIASQTVFKRLRIQVVLIWHHWVHSQSSRYDSQPRFAIEGFDLRWILAVLVDPFRHS